MLQLIKIIINKENLHTVISSSCLNFQAPIEVIDTPPSPPPPAPAPVVTATLTTAAPAARVTRSQHYNPEENTITNICTSNIILDLPQVTTRSRTGATKQQQAPPPVAPNPPTVTKIIIKQTPTGAVSVTATPSSSPRQPPPLQQMQSTPPRLQQMVHAQAPPPLQAKPRGGGGAAAASAAPPPLQIKVVPSSRQSGSSAPIIVTSAGETPVAATASSSALTMEVDQSATGEDVAEDGVSQGNAVRRFVEKTTMNVKKKRLNKRVCVVSQMEVELNVMPGSSLAAANSSNICIRDGCTNPVVESKDWDKEYCSNECVASHCRCVCVKCHFISKHAEKNI